MRSRRVLEDVELVFHQAAIPSVRARSSSARNSRCQCNGTFSLLLAARDRKCDELFMRRQSSVYGDQAEIAKTRNDAARILVPICRRKARRRILLSVSPGSYGLETVSLRYFNVFGPRQDPGSHTPE